MPDSRSSLVPSELPQVEGPIIEPVNAQKWASDCLSRGEKRELAAALTARQSYSQRERITLEHIDELVQAVSICLGEDIRGDRKYEHAISADDIRHIRGKLRERLNNIAPLEVTINPDDISVSRLLKIIDAVYDRALWNSIDLEDKEEAMRVLVAKGIPSALRNTIFMQWLRKKGFKRPKDMLIRQVSSRMKLLKSRKTPVKTEDTSWSNEEFAKLDAA